MMELKDQVASLELSKELKELGYPQESLWYWYETDKYADVVANECVTDHDSERIYSAPTTAELGEALPWEIPSNGLTKFLKYTKTDIEHFVYYQCGSAQPDIKFKADTEANARAKMLIHLIKNGVVKL